MVTNKKLIQNINRIGSLINEGDGKKSKMEKYLRSEMDELQRAVQDLNRDEDIDISVDQIFDKFMDGKETKLTKSVWRDLENTESNEIDKGDFDEVYKIADKYNKSNPDKLKKSMMDDDYNPPLIINFGDRYHLVAGNTRLCFAAALGISPRVIKIKI